MTRGDEMQDELMCKHCGGPIAIRNPSGACDHLYWPDYLTDEAKLTNGFALVQKNAWEDSDDKW
jgi:hypothetical protein